MQEGMRSSLQRRLVLERSIRVYPILTVVKTIQMKAKFTYSWVEGMCGISLLTDSIFTKKCQHVYLLITCRWKQFLSLKRRRIWRNKTRKLGGQSKKCKMVKSVLMTFNWLFFRFIRMEFRLNMRLFFLKKIRVNFSLICISNSREREKERGSFLHFATILTLYYLKT